MDFFHSTFWVWVLKLFVSPLKNLERIISAYFCLFYIYNTYLDCECIYSLYTLRLYLNSDSAVHIVDVFFWLDYFPELLTLSFSLRSVLKVSPRWFSTVTAAIYKQLLIIKYISHSFQVRYLA